MSSNLMRWNASVCCVNNNDNKLLIAFGGFGPNKVNNKKRSPDCRLDTIVVNNHLGNINNSVNKNYNWNIVESKSANKPCGRLHHCGIVVNDHQILIHGGRRNPKKALNDCWLLNIPSYEWKQIVVDNNKSPSLWRHTATLMNNKIYVFGGRNEMNVYNTLYYLDINTYEWYECKEMDGDIPSPRHSHTTVAYNNRLYVYGGTNMVGTNVYDNKKDPNLYEYNPNTNKWCIINKNSPLTMYSHTAVVFNDNMIVLGGAGESCAVSINKLLIYNFHLNQWFTPSITAKSQPPFYHFALMKHRMIVLDELNILVCGGGSQCFSFGTQFNSSILLTWKSSNDIINQSVNVKVLDDYNNSSTEQKIKSIIDEDNNDNYDHNQVADKRNSNLKSNEVLAYQCNQCNERFSSRNKLFQHIRIKGHIVKK